jgi:hypothetical protein
MTENAWRPPPDSVRWPCRCSWKSYRLVWERQRWVWLAVEGMSTLTTALQRDILQSLTACLPVYGSTMILGFMSDLWESLKTEVTLIPSTST